MAMKKVRKGRDCGRASEKETSHTVFKVDRLPFKLVCTLTVCQQTEQWVEWI